MRIPIREQLTLLILFAALIGLAVISVPTWITSRDFIVNARSQLLSNIASLKADQLTANLELMQTTVAFVSTRIVIQEAVVDYNQHNVTTGTGWVNAHRDMEAAVSGSNSVGQDILLQTMILPKSPDGPAGTSSLLNVTSSAHGDVVLHYDCLRGTKVGQRAVLGMTYDECGDLGYPRPLYPNLTYSADDGDEVKYHGMLLTADSSLLLGPWRINDTLELVSITVPMIDVNITGDVVGWLTFVMNWKLISTVLDSSQDLGKTGITLLIGPASTTNLFADDVFYETDNGQYTDDYLVRFVVPVNDTARERHPNHDQSSDNPPFLANEYPAIVDAVSKSDGNQDNSASLLRTHNEAGEPVAVGYAVLQIDLVDWVIIVEESQSAIFGPLNKLRNLQLYIIVGTLVFIALVSFPLAHFASAPIRRLREATEKSVAPPAETGRYSSDSFMSDADATGAAPETDQTEHTEIARKEGLVASLLALRPSRRRQNRETRAENQRRREFRIPGRVKERQHFIKDELSDLTMTFNEMSDELMMQYERLEERVKQRTAELELSKKAAEAANESKTLFIANISHELKTPLNGILGMCAVCMQEDDPLRIKRSLGIIYKSGDLLLNLLTDLLTFSKNQVGQQLTLDEKEFLLRDVSSQVLAIFEKQARKGKIDLRVDWEGSRNLSQDNASPERGDGGPTDTNRLRNMVLYGDVQRLLQVLINLVSNALKFTPEGGQVAMTIRCLAERPQDESRKNSLTSRQSRQGSSGRNRNSDGTISGLSALRLDTANSINPRDKPNGLVRLSQASIERHPSPPPGALHYFEFEVNDTGPGIHENLHAKIFEPFMQGDLGLSKKHAGTGLGLSICSQLAGLMRGSIGVRSTVGVGSTFTMKIPLRLLKTRAESVASSGIDDLYDGTHRVSISSDEGTPTRRLSRANDIDEPVTVASPERPGPRPTKSGGDSQPRLVGLRQPFFAPHEAPDTAETRAAAAKQMAADMTHSSKRVRVLVADDNKVNQEVVCRMLKLEDVYDVTVAKDGQEALDLVKETLVASSPTEPSPAPFDLIFMDVQMPNVDGLESTRLIRACGYQAPIVALTAFAEESNVRDCLESGMNYFLSKPIRRPQLKKVLKEYCPPIPEESEESTSPTDVHSKPKSTDPLSSQEVSPHSPVRSRKPPSQPRPKSDLSAAVNVGGTDPATTADSAPAGTTDVSQASVSLPAPADLSADGVESERSPGASQKTS